MTTTEMERAERMEQLARHTALQVWMSAVPAGSAFDPEKAAKVIADLLSFLQPVRAEGETAYVKDVTDLLVRYRVAVRDFMHRRGVQSNPAVSDDWIINQLMSAPVRAEEPKP